MYARRVSDRPSTNRHADVLITVWIIVGAAVILVLNLADTLRLPSLGLAAVGAIAAGYGETVARKLRPGMRFTEVVVAVVIAFVLVPGVARFGMTTFDRDALTVIAVGTPLGLGAAWAMRRWHVGAGNYPEVATGVMMMGAAVGLGVVVFTTLHHATKGGSIERHTIDAGFLIAAAAAGLVFGAVVPGARAGHLMIGAAFVLLAPRIIQLGALRLMPLGEVMRWTLELGVAGGGLCVVGRFLRQRAVARAVPDGGLPAARIHGGDAGEGAAPDEAR